MTSAPGKVRAYGALALYLGGVFVGGSLLAPWLYGAGGALAAHVPALAPLGAYPFHRYVERSVLLVAFAGLWPFLRALGIRSWRNVGLPGGPGRLRRLGLGLVVGFGTTALVAVAALAGGARTLALQASAGTLAQGMAQALVAAGAVALLEETLYRGVLFGGLSRAVPWVQALLLTSAFYAAVHFLNTPSDPAVVTWSTAVRQLPMAFAPLGDPGHLFPGFLNLTLAGSALALVYRRTGDLWCSFGLHAGWVFFGRLYNLVTAAAAGGASPKASLLLSGWLPLLALSATVVGVVWLFPEGMPEGAGGD